MNPKTKAYLSYAYVAIIWGTTYFAIRVAVLHLPPFLMAGIRQIVSFFVIAAIALSLNRQYNFSKQNLLCNAIIGFLMITIGNGVVSAAERIIPSGVAALVCSMMPISVVILNLLFSKAERPTPLIVLGMLLGFTGVALIFRNDMAALSDPQYLFGILATLVATFGWGGGSILSKKWSNPVNPMLDAGVQVGFGGIFLLLFSPLIDDYSTTDWHNAEALWALVYLIIFGSVIAFTAYRYALKNLPVGFVTSYAYINPLVAVIIGFFAGEVVTAWTILSFIAIITGVAIVNTGYQRRKKQSNYPIAQAALPEFE